MKKRILSIVLSIVMLVGLLPTTALAINVYGHDGHFDCGESCSHVADDPHKTVEDADWEEWISPDYLPTAAGNYYLAVDVTIGSTWVPSTDTVLCLNGHSITKTGTGTVIRVSANRTFTLTDCGSGKITGGSSGVDFMGNGNFYMYGGSITGVATDFGGGVNMSLGSFTMYGGSISGNTATKNGGGVYMTGGTFTMHGGSITDNTANFGGGVYMGGGTFTMSDGSIADNTANQNGGGVCMEYYTGNPVFTISGTAEITDNSANGYGGGGVYFNYGNFTMSGGSITGNTTTGDGGGVYVYSTPINISGSPVITGNTKSGSANNVYGTSAFITVTDALTTDAEIGVTTSNATGSTLTMESKDNLSSIGDEDIPLYFTSDIVGLEIVKDTSGELVSREAPKYTVTFDANGHGAAPAAISDVVSGSTINAPTAPEDPNWTFGGWYKEQTCENAWNFDTDTVKGDIILYARWFEKHDHKNCGVENCTAGHGCSNTSFLPWDGTDTDNTAEGIQIAAGNYYLTDNVILTDTITISSGTVNLCLNGNSLNNSSNAVKVESGGTFNLCDCKGGGSVTATGTKKEGIINSGIASIYGGTVSGTLYGISNSSSSTVNVFGGIVEDTNSSSYGIANLGTVNVSGGAVNGSSRGIENMNSGGNAKVNVTGGTVTGSRYGIYNSYGCSVTVSGGTVKSTGTDGNNHGIYNYQGSLELSGVPTITGNTAGIHLAKDQAITISGALTYAEAKAISVKMNTPDTFTSGWTTKMGGNAANYGSYFTSADSTYTVQPDGNNELKLAEPPAHSHDNCGVENCEADHNHSTVNSWTAWDGTDDFPGGDVYLTDDVTLTDTLTISSGTVNLCLNGKSITSSLSSTIQVNSGATLNICDCSTGETAGKIANACASSNGRGIYNLGTVTVYGGTIEATGDSGRGIYNGTVNIYGGTIQATGTGIYLNNGTGTVSGGTVRATGTGIYLNSGCSVTVSGGTIEATGDNGRGIDNSSGANATVSGGSISGASYGIHNGYAGSCELSGDPTITGTAADVYIGGNGAKIITITGALNYAEGNAISVEMSTPGTFTSGWNTYMTSADSSDYFTSADNGYTVQKDYSGELELAEPLTIYTVTVSNDGNGTASAFPTSGAEGTEITLTATPASGYHFKEWQVLSGGVTISNNKFTMPASAVEIKAVFEADTPGTYTVTYLPGANGTGTQTTDTKTQGVALTLKGVIFTRTGYTQTGWATTDGGAKAYELNGTYSDNAPVSLYPVWTANTYKVTFNANGGAGMMAEQSFTHGEAEKALTANTFTRADHIFTGWNTAANGSGTAYADGASISLTGDLTLYAQWTEVHNITGTVTEQDSGPLVGISVKLMQGNNKLAEDTTKDGGVFAFNNVPLGSYNVVAEKMIDSSTKTKTELVVIEHEDVNNLSVIMPSQNVSSTLAVTGNDTPDIVVGGLDDEAVENAADGSTHVSIGMSIEKQADATDGGESAVKTQQEAIKTVAGGAQAANIDFLDIKVQKTTTTGSGSETTTITDTQTVLELIIPYDMTGKHGITVYRYHDGRAEAFRKLNGKPTTSKQDGTFWLDETNHFIYTYTNQFSTYAIGYNSAGVYNITLNANGGTVSSATLTTDTSGKLTSLPTPTRSGSYTFNGWYTAASGGTQVTTATEFSSNQTIYAQWTYTGGTGGGGGGYTPTYAIIVEDAENGEVKANRSYASSGSTVTITVDPEAGYVLNKLTVKDDQGNKIEVTDKGDGTYTFKMPSRKVTVTAAFATDGSFSVCPGDHTCPIWPYTDAEATAWYHDGVHYCIENGLMTGYGNGIFKPNADTTRAMITVMLWRLNGSPVVNYLLDFEDVEEGQWYTEAIRWAKSEGIATGYGNGYFGTNDAITREQMVTILWRYAQYKGIDVSVGENTNILSYNDAFDVAEYAIPAMQWACGSGMVQGMNDPDGEGMILAPESKGTRAQIATMMMRFCTEIMQK